MLELGALFTLILLGVVFVVVGAILVGVVQLVFKVALIPLTIVWAVVKWTLLLVLVPIAVIVAIPLLVVLAPILAVVAIVAIPIVLVGLVVWGFGCLIF